MLANVVTTASVDDEMEAWEYLTLYNTSANPPASCTAADCSGAGGDYDWFRIGLFSHDLTTFESDCDTSENCNQNDYVDFDGWAIGMYAHTYSAIVEDQGFCFSADNNCLFLYYISGTYSITSFEAPNDVAIDVPATSSIEAALEYGLYGFDNFEWVLPDESKPFAYRFLRPTDTAYW